jgi:hypothetical protein
MHQLSWLALLALAVTVTPARGQENAGSRWPITDVVAPTAELALELYVNIAPRVEVGATDDGVRQFIPIGRPSAATASAARSCRAGQIGAPPRRRSRVYACIRFRTDDGAVIVVDNRGIVAGGAAGRRRQRTYGRARFHAPQGKVIGSTRPYSSARSPAAGGGAVIIRAFRVR